MTQHHSAHKDSLVIDGRRYGARTGRPLDGLSHPTRHSQPTHAAAHANRPHHAVAAHNIHHRPQPPARHATPIKAKTQVVVTNIVPPIPLAPGLEQSAQLTAQRAGRAQSVARSTKISKFVSFVPPADSQPATQVPMPRQQPTTPLPLVEPTHTSPPLPAEQPQPTVAETTAIIAHKPQRGRRISRALHRPKAMTVAAAALSGLIIIGYITYLNVPHIALRVAASRAGIDADLPNYQPSGFRFAGPIAYSPGSIVLNFRSTTGDERAYTIIERRSEWDSASLLENYVRDKTDQPLTFQQRGLTVYVYDGSSATWVNRGLWYTIEGNSLLNFDQILKIAASL